MKVAVAKARRFVGSLREGDEDAIATATLIQGILSGDVVAASIHTRQRLQRENFRLRARVTRARLKTELAKQRLIESEIEMRTRPAQEWPQVMTRIYEIYGLKYNPTPALPPAIITAE